MANGLGDLAAGFFQSFSQAQAQKQEREQREEYQDILTKLAEFSLKDAETKSEAIERIQAAIPAVFGSRPAVGGMDARNALVSGQPAPEGPEPIRDLSGMMADFVLADMMPQFQQMQAMQGREELSSGIEGFGGSPQEFFNTPEGASAAVQAGVSPMQFFGQQASREPSSVQIARTFGLQPGTPEFQETVMKLETQDASAVEALQAQIGLMGAQMDLQEQMRDFNAERRTEEETVEDTVEAVTAVADSLDTLENSFLEPGAPLSEARMGILSGAAFISELTNIGDPTKMQEVITAAGEYQKATADLVNMLQSRMAANGIQMTNQAREMIQNASASKYLNPAANRAVLQRLLSDAIRDAERLEFGQEDLGKMRSLLERLEGSSEEGVRVGQFTVEEVN